MIRLNKTLRIFEARIILTMRKHIKLTRAEALLKLREVTSGKGLETMDCYMKLLTSSNREESVNHIFGV